MKYKYFFIFLFLFSCTSVSVTNYEKPVLNSKGFAYIYLLQDLMGVEDIWIFIVSNVLARKPFLPA